MPRRRQGISGAICVLCGKYFEGAGHNAAPVTEGRCCNQCNSTKVIPARIRAARIEKEHAARIEKEQK